MPPPPSSSLYPTTRPPSKKTDWLARAKELYQLAAIVFTVLGAVAGGAWKYIDQLASDAEVVAALERHNADLKAHEKTLNERLLLLEISNKRLQAEGEETLQLWRIMVGYAAVDRERDARLHAAASAHYREEFDSLIRHGKSPETAYREALQDPWLDRPRNR